MASKLSQHGVKSELSEAMGGRKRISKSSISYRSILLVCTLKRKLSERERRVKYQKIRKKIYITRYISRVSYALVFYNIMIFKKNIKFTLCFFILT